MSARWTRIGKSNIDLTAIIPELDLYDRDWPIWTYAEITPPAKFVHEEVGRRGEAISSLVSGGCIVSGALLRQSLLFTGVHVHSFSRVEQAVILPDADIGRGARLRNVIVEKRRANTAGPCGGRGRGGGRSTLPPYGPRDLPDHAADDRSPGRLTFDPRARRRVGNFPAGEDRRSRRCNRRSATGTSGSRRRKRSPWSRAIRRCSVP